MTGRVFGKSTRKLSVHAALLCPLIFLLRIQKRQRRLLQQRMEMMRRRLKRRIRTAGIQTAGSIIPMRKQRNLTPALKTIPLRIRVRLKPLRPVRKTKRMTHRILLRSPATKTLRMLHRRRSPMKPETLPRQKAVPMSRPLRMTPAA